MSIFRRDFAAPGFLLHLFPGIARAGWASGGPRSHRAPAMDEKTHIIVVDDEPDIREMLQEYLAGQGFAVSTADGGGELRF